jgi:hypothetical protein
MQLRPQQARPGEGPRWQRMHPLPAEGSHLAAARVQPPRLRLRRKQPF